MNSHPDQGQQASTPSWQDTTGNADIQDLKTINGELDQNQESFRNVIEKKSMEHLKKIFWPNQDEAPNVFKVKQSKFNLTNQCMKTLLIGQTYYVITVG